MNPCPFINSILFKTVCILFDYHSHRMLLLSRPLCYLRDYDITAPLISQAIHFLYMLLDVISLLIGLGKTHRGDGFGWKRQRQQLRHVSRHKKVTSKERSENKNRLKYLSTAILLSTTVAEINETLGRATD